ncbi:MAG: response regulator [Ignavibacteria bacterium]|nr:response regulator [Ignavibacteria bacterium]
MIKTSRKIKILVVDDSDVILNLFKEIFGSNSYEVITCSDGLEGIQKAAEEKPDIIFLDLMMPNFDGIKMLQVKKVLKDIQDIPTVVISANTARPNVLAAIEAGADKVVSKPLQKSVILKYVEELINEKDKKPAAVLKANSNDETVGIQSKLVTFFLNTYPAKKKTIQQAIKTKNEESLKMIIHEFKGAGGTIGYPEITEISKEIEAREMKSATDWIFVEFKCNKLFQIIDNIK